MNAETIAAWVIIICALAWLLADRIVVGLAWIDRLNWESQIAEAIRLTEEDDAADEAWDALTSPAINEHVAKYAAEDIEREWAELNGDVS